MNQTAISIPTSEELDDILCESDILKAAVRESLLAPVHEFFTRPGKNLRSSLVELGYHFALRNEINELSSDAARKLSVASSIVELIHGGSLIVDDIQDDSVVRRSSPSLHILHGMPKALNAGNWLYFWALTRVRDLGLPPEREHLLIQDVVELMMKAHAGQALDIGMNALMLPRENIRQTCLSTIELKTGTVMTIAIRLGSAVADSSWKDSSLQYLGPKLGTILQMYDDISNLLIRNEKQYEDLISLRPSWVWAVASEMSREKYDQFVDAVLKLPEDRELIAWMEECHFKDHLLNETRAVRSFFEETWKSEWRLSHPRSLEQLLKFCQKLEMLYVL